MDASDIFQVYLDGVSHSVLTEDRARYRCAMHPPCHIISHDESKVVATDEDLNAGFDMFCQTLRFHKVTDFIRLVEVASRVDAELISGSYVTPLISGGQRVMPPFRSQLTLRLFDGQWRAVSITNAFANSRWPLVRLALHPDKPPEGPKQ